MAGINENMVDGAASKTAPVEQAAENAGEQIAAEQGAAPTEINAEEPTPEEQEQFTKYEVAVKSIVHGDEKRFDSLVEMLKAGKDDPIRTLAKVALSVFGILDGDVEGGIEEEYLLSVAEVCLDYVIQVAEQVGLMQIDEQMAEAAMIEMVKQAGELYDFDTTGIDDAVVNGKANYAARQPGAQQADPAQQEQTQPVQQVEGVV